MPTPNDQTPTDMLFPDDEYEKPPYLENNTAVDDLILEWECAAAAFKQMAFMYATFLKRSPDQCERDLRKALQLVIQKHPQFKDTVFYREAHDRAP